MLFFGPILGLHAVGSMYRCTRFCTTYDMKEINLHKNDTSSVEQDERYKFLLDQSFKIFGYIA